MSAPVHHTPTSAGEALPPSAPVPLVPSFDDVLGDLGALVFSGQLRDVRLTCSAHKDPAKREFILSGDTPRRRVTVVATILERAAERLVEMAEQDAAQERLVADSEPLLSAERDVREAAE